MTQSVADAGALDFSRRAETWLATNAPGFEDPDPRYTGFPNRSIEEQADVVANARAWEALKAAQGWAGLAVPTAWAGQGMTAYDAEVFRELESRYKLDYETFAIAKMMITPTLLRWGSNEQKMRYLPRILDGRDVWCQLFSEPAAGSDLAALTTRAERTGHGWRLRGQKVWNSGANFADRGYVLARTAVDKPKHDGLTAFVIDMTAPGVSVRPIRQIPGGYGFCEVFLDDVELGDDAVVGAVDSGWKVAITTLMNERLAMSVANVPWPGLLALLAEGAVHQADRVRAARIFADYRAVEQIHHEEVLALRGDTAQPGPEGSILKLMIGRLQTEIGRLACDVLASRGQMSDRWTESFLGSFGTRIGGGTDEVLKNVIADRVLLLPKEPRHDLAPGPSNGARP
ncbi:acyl-CoA dehydrogenase family protein [Williamsia muralis]|uniref:acyl-CoA dehydrogenase family protein n=1 Tax=Williamsia marianensis TaxID=85044 RepID=UPI003F13651F